MASSIQDIEKAIKSINTEADKRDEMRIMMAPYAKWDEFLAPAPMTICILGQLFFISGDSDFSLKDKNNETTFKLLKYPDSFRACLVQVATQGWQAFDKAHTNMDQIRLLSGNVEGHVKHAVNFIMKGTPQEVELILPESLKSIENIADQCVIRARSVEEEFVLVMNVVGEFLAACTQARGLHEEELKTTNIAIEVAKKSMKELEKQKIEAEANRKEMMNQMKEAESEYKKAMNNVPGAGGLAGLAFADCFIDAVKKVSDIGPAIAMSYIFPNRGIVGNIIPTTGTSNDNKTTVEAQRQPSTSSETRNSAIKNVLSFLRKIKGQVIRIEELALGKGKEPNWNEIGEKNEAERIKQEIQSFKRGIPKSAPEIEKKIIQLIEDGVDVCEKLLKLQGSMTRDEDDMKEVMELAKNLSSGVETLSTGLDLAISANSLPNKSPHQANQDVSQQMSGDESLMKSALQSAKFKTEVAKQNLSETKKLYDESCKKIDEKMQRMGKVLAELAAYQPKKLDLELIRQRLVKGIHALGELREQWGQLVKFFHMLSNLVKCCLESSLKQFVSTTKSQMKLTSLGMEMTNIMRYALYEQAFKANQIAYVVKGIAEVYTKVFEDHLMDRINCLGSLLSLDPVSDKQKISQKREELDRGCKEAQQAIRTIAAQKKREIDDAFEKRIGRIEMEVEAVMPPMEKGEIKEIDEKVKTAMAIRKAALEVHTNDM